MTPSFTTSLRDVSLVARFELLRAIRTWQGLAVIILYVIASIGSTYLFVQILGALERELAFTLQVPPTDTPGAMLDSLVNSKNFRDMVAFFVGDERLVDATLFWSPVATFHLWMNLLLMPFLATFVSADAISVDLRSRALRFELLRTGRLELVSGRFLAQAILCGIAGLAAAGASWTVALLTMVGNDAFWLGVGLLWAGWRSWVFGLAFVGLGVGVSQLTASPAWARILGLVGTALTWGLFGLLAWATTQVPAWIIAPLQLTLPQTWIRLLWEGGTLSLAAAVFLVALGLTWMTAGYVVTARRDA